MGNERADSHLPSAGVTFDAAMRAAMQLTCDVEAVAAVAVHLRDPGSAHEVIAERIEEIARTVLPGVDLLDPTERGEAVAAGIDHGRRHLRAGAAPRCSQRHRRRGE
jgi:hypothetical protein